MISSTLTRPALHTAQDLERLSAQGYHYELIKGELHEMAPPGGTHGSTTSRLSVFVGSLVIDKDLGETFAAETGFLVGRDPDTVLAPDFAFVSKGRLPNPLPKSYVPVVPDIVLETRSPNDTKREVADKVEQWLALGVRLVWELNPQTRILTVHRANQMPRFLGENDTLDGEEVLPGFSVPIARLFP
jgi:Uma2 family endonuclease